MISQEESKDLINSIEAFFENYSLSKIDSEIEDLKIKLNNEEIWKDPEAAGKLNKSLAFSENKKSKIASIFANVDNLKAAIDLNESEEINSVFKILASEFSYVQNQEFLTGKFDGQDAQLSIHAGAGGVDAQDWSAMLCSMYQAFSNKQGWSLEIISISPGEEGGLKSVTMNIKGLNVYGLLKEEAGVHRLVRISPFNSGKTRETSFALVEVIPLNLDLVVTVNEIPEKDLKWEYSMSSGKGGQSVNTTYSAVRLVHLPTNISVTCQNERSQLQNKQQALKYLRNRLAALEVKKSQELKNELKGSFVSAEWGSQIRSYVLHPYKLVKDHRSGYESCDTNDVLEQGNILPFIWSVKSNNLVK